MFGNKVKKIGFKGCLVYWVNKHIETLNAFEDVKIIPHVDPSPSPDREITLKDWGKSDRGYDYPECAIDAFVSDNTTFEKIVSDSTIIEK